MTPRPVPARYGPATNAARRAGQSTFAAALPARSHPHPLDPDDATGDSMVHAATRALLGVSSRAGAAHVVWTAVHDLGGGLVPARLADSDAIPVDVSLGVGEPMLVFVDPLSMAALRLAHHLPGLVQDALLVAAGCDNTNRQTHRAAIDGLTGVASRAEIGPRLGHTQPGDVVCLLDLDGFKSVNDTLGHAAGDAALRAFGALVRASLRSHDFCGRYGGDEFLIVLQAAPVPAAHDRLRTLGAEWVRQQGATSVSTGIAVIGAAGHSVATRAADRALYRAKKLGRNRVEIAAATDYDAEERTADADFRDRP